MTFRLSGKSCKNNLIFCGRPFYITLPEGSWHFILLTYLRALLNFSYVILSFFFLCPHIFARASDLTTRKIPCSLSSHSRMPQFSSGDRSRSRTNSHRWELCRPLRRKKSYLFFFLIVRENLYNLSLTHEHCCFVGLPPVVVMECSTWDLTELWNICLW